MPSAKAEKKVRETAWNLRKPGGWEAYKVKTDELAEKLEKIVDDEEKSVEKVMQNLLNLKQNSLHLVKQGNKDALERSQTSQSKTAALKIINAAQRKKSIYVF